MTVWNHDAWSLPPVADAVGPFPGRAFLRAVHGDVTLIASADGAMSVVELDGTIQLAGEADLTDYHSPLGTSMNEVIERLVEQSEADSLFDFDSLPHEAAQVIMEGLELAGLDASCDRHAVTAVVDLPDSFEEYLANLGKKQRHEVRRKRRRYEELVGSVVHETHIGVDWAFDEFVRLHRLSSGEKGDFMTSEHERVFRALAASPGWRLDMLRVPDTDRAAACLFSYSDEDGIYLYNSAYDPALSHASPGVAIIGTMIETAIGEGLPRFDFLKGDEAYKFRLGAKERPLYRIRAAR